MRFRLRTPFLTFARDQVRGGLWFRPAWLDAVAKVPPAHFQPRLKMRNVPKITFLEDKLLRCVRTPPAAPRAPRGALALSHPLHPRPPPSHSRFRDRNAAIATFDHAGATSTFSRTIAAQFVEQQLARMRGGAAEEAAYAGARSWMLSEGPRLFAGLKLPEVVRAAATATPETVAASRAAADEALAKQLADVREAFAA